MRRLRIALFLGLAVFMLAGPVYRQLLDGGYPLFRQWTMFSQVAIGLADVRFSERGPDGRLRPLDHYRALGYVGVRDAPLHLRRIVGLEGVRAVAAAVCGRLGTGADLRARVRIAQREGWRTEWMEADGNLCLAASASGSGGNDAPGD